MKIIHYHCNMYKFKKDFIPDKVRMKSHTGERPQSYGFALIYPQTISLITDQVRNYLDSFINTESVDQFNFSTTAIKMYVALCSNVSKSRPYPIFDFYKYSEAPYSIYVGYLIPPFGLLVFEYLKAIGLISVISSRLEDGRNANDVSNYSHKCSINIYDGE